MSGHSFQKKQFKDPLFYASASDVSKYRRAALFFSLKFIVGGLLFILTLGTLSSLHLINFLEPGCPDTTFCLASNPYSRGSFDTSILTIMGILAITFGVFSLLRLKPRMKMMARRDIASRNPKLKHELDIHEAKYFQSSSSLYKRIAVGLFVSLGLLIVWAAVMLFVSRDNW